MNDMNSITEKKNESHLTLSALTKSRRVAFLPRRLTLHWLDVFIQKPKSESGIGKILPINILLRFTPVNYSTRRDAILSCSIFNGLINNNTISNLSSAHRYYISFSTFGFRNMRRSKNLTFLYPIIKIFRRNPDKSGVAKFIHRFLTFV